MLTVKGYTKTLTVLSFLSLLHVVAFLPTFAAEGPTKRLFMEAIRTAHKSEKPGQVHLVDDGTTDSALLLSHWKNPEWNCTAPRVDEETIRSSPEGTRIESRFSIIVVHPIKAPSGAKLMGVTKALFLRSTLILDTPDTRTCRLENAARWALTVDHRAKSEFAEGKERKWKTMAKSRHALNAQERAAALIGRATELLIYEDDFRRAAPLLEQVPEVKKRPTCCIGLAQCYWRAGNEQKAVEWAVLARKAAVDTGYRMKKQQSNLLDFICKDGGL